ncbi:MAG: hypothetical protein Q4P14_05600 [Methanobacteriaceae archaeon]|nr:hypothetical protein [Methanobacteriaceae archaeon]
MEIVEGIAIIILVLAVLFLVYYYLKNLNSFDASATSESIKGLFNSPRSSTTETGDVSNDSTTVNIDDESVEEDEEKVSTVDKLKISIKDIDMAAALNTDAFSKRLDAFLDEKSEELIENWSLATTNDLSSLEERCELACNNIDDLEKRFSEYADVTDSKLEDLDNRLKALESED